MTHRTLISTLRCSGFLAQSTYVQYLAGSEWAAEAIITQAARLGYTRDETITALRNE